MNSNRLINRLLLGAALLGASLAHAAGQNVTALADDSIDVYARNADYFVRSGSLSRSEIQLPAAVLEESPRGYVRVALAGREVWFDSMDVTVYPPKGSGSTGCVFTALDSKSGTGRGAGEGCH